MVVLLALVISALAPVAGRKGTRPGTCRSRNYFSDLELNQQYRNYFENRCGNGAGSSQPGGLTKIDRAMDNSKRVLGGPNLLQPLTRRVGVEHVASTLYFCYRPNGNE